MLQPLAEQDERTLVQCAEQVETARAEAARQRARLKDADDAALRAVLFDRAAPRAARGTALLQLLMRNRQRRTAVASEILLPLWDDPDIDLACMAIQQAACVDIGLADRLHALLDHPEPRIWSTAASALARQKDATIVPQLRAWFDGADRSHRNVAYACLCFYQLLAPDERHALLRNAWDEGGRGDDDRTMLAIGLLDLGDRTGWSFLVDLARRADAYAAVSAIDAITKHDPALGLELMLHILDHGATFRVRWAMVERIASCAGLPHVWTVDGLAEARHWVEQQQALLESAAAASGRDPAAAPGLILRDGLRSPPPRVC